MLAMSAYENVDQDLFLLRKLLFKADRQTHVATNFYQALFSFFGYPTDFNQSLPIAVYAMESVANDAFCVIAEPVHLRADQATLRLFDQRLLDISDDEWADLYSVCRDFFAEQDWVLIQSEDKRWYLQPSGHNEIITTAICDVMGDSIDPQLPTGKDAMFWHRLMNELQMLLHTHPVNIAREQQEKPMINSLWFWGAGKITQTIKSELNYVWGGGSEVKGLSRSAQIKHSNITDFDRQLASRQLATGKHLLIIDDLMSHNAYQDVEDWYQCLTTIIQDYFSPLLELLQAGKLDELIIYPVNGVSYRITPRNLRYFWRRIKALQDIA